MCSEGKHRPDQHRVFDTGDTPYKLQRAVKESGLNANMQPAPINLRIYTLRSP